MQSSNMTTISKSLLAFAVVGAVAGLIGFFGYSPFIKPVIEQIAGTSPAGTTSQTAKFFAIAVNLAAPGANATSSSILNSSANDYYITAIKAGCQGVGSSFVANTGTGLVSLQLTVATTSTAAPAANGANKVGGSTVVIATSSSSYVVASSTAGNPNSNGLSSNVWAAGSYLTFTTNATNTAMCTFGADVFSS